MFINNNRKKMLAKISACAERFFIRKWIVRNINNRRMTWIAWTRDIIFRRKHLLPKSWSMEYFASAVGARVRAISNCSRCLSLPRSSLSAVCFLIYYWSFHSVADLYIRFPFEIVLLPFVIHISVTHRLSSCASFWPESEYIFVK